MALARNLEPLLELGHSRVSFFTIERQRGAYIRRPGTVGRFRSIHRGNEPVNTKSEPSSIIALIVDSGHAKRAKCP